ncbi:unnamed protein product [Withania somnifera]
MEKKILFGKYETGKQLGKGTFAKVFHATNLIKKEIVKSQEMMEQIKREISVMRLVRQPNIVELKEVMATKTKIFIVMEYVKGGELFAKVAKGRLNEDVARKYFQRLISAWLCFERFSKLNKESYSLFVDCSQTNFEIKVLLGLLYTRCGTPAYIAPEIIRNKGYNGGKSDIWSCGVVLYVLLAVVKIFKVEYRFPPWLSTEAKRLISRILVPNPQKRISTMGIMKDPWFRKGFIIQINGISSSSIDHEHDTISMLDKFGKEENLKHGGMMKSPSSPPLLNAFELISSMSLKTETIFTSRCSATIIMAKIQLLAKKLNFKVARINGSTLRLQVHQVFEEDVKPNLKDIVWTWHVEEVLSGCDPEECKIPLKCASCKDLSQNKLEEIDIPANLSSKYVTRALII